MGRTERVRPKRGNGFAYAKSFFVHASDTSYTDLKIQAMRYSPSEASFVATNEGARVSSGSLYKACDKSSNGDTVISLNLDSKCRIWLYASLRRGDEFLFNFDFEICDGEEEEGGFIRVERPRIAAMGIPLWQSEFSRSNTWKNCIVSSRKICNSGDLDATVLISWYRNQVERAGSCAVALSSFKRRNKNASLELRSVHDPSVKIATLNMTCSFKLKNSTYRELNGLFRRRRGASPRVSTTSEESKSVTSIAARVTKKQSSDDEIAIFEINRRGSVVPVLRTTHDAKSTTLSRSLTPCHHQERKIAVREERARLETLNELFVKLEDKRPVVKLRDRRAQLEAIEREMHHLLSLRLRRREVENREDNVEDKNRANQHLIAYHSKSALIKQRHDHTDDSWSKSTRFARDNIFLKRAVREFRSHTRHSLHASKHPISELRTKNMESHWLKSRTQTHSLADDDSWYVVFIQT